MYLRARAPRLDSGWSRAGSSDHAPRSHDEQAMKSAGRVGRSWAAGGLAVQHRVPPARFALAMVDAESKPVEAPTPTRR